MNLYRIYTENKDLPKIKEICNKYADGYTLIPAVGCWKGTEEHSVIIEIIGTEDDQFTKVNPIAQEIAWVNHQESVLVTVCPITSYSFGQ